jgi:hypothetical protein
MKMERNQDENQTSRIDELEHNYKELTKICISMGNEIIKIKDYISVLQHYVLSSMMNTDEINKDNLLNYIENNFK